MKKKQVETAKTKEPKNLFHRLQKRKNSALQRGLGFGIGNSGNCICSFSCIIRTLSANRFTACYLAAGMHWRPLRIWFLMFGKTGTVLSVLSILIGFACILLYVIATRLSQG